jgi:predicted RNase H-like HicB family nuclease
MIMKSIVLFTIQKGKKYYTAQGVDVPVITQAKTLDELTSNITEALDLHFKNEDITDLGFISKPSILINFEIPRLKHA